MAKCKSCGVEDLKWVECENSRTSRIWVLEELDGEKHICRQSDIQKHYNKTQDDQKEKERLVSEYKNSNGYL